MGDPSDSESGRPPVSGAGASVGALDLVCGIRSVRTAEERDQVIVGDLGLGEENRVAAASGHPFPQLGGYRVDTVLRVSAGLRSQRGATVTNRMPQSHSGADQVALLPPLSTKLPKRGHERAGLGTGWRPLNARPDPGHKAPG